MRGNWEAYVDPEAPDRIVILRHPASARKMGHFTREDLTWVTDRLKAREAFEANLKADPYTPADIDQVIDGLRRAREVRDLTFHDVGTAIASDGSLIKRSEEGKSTPKWDTLKLWAWVLGFDIVLKAREPK